MGEKKTNREWCQPPQDLKGYKSDLRSGVCMDTVGRGSRTDYCRMVSRYDPLGRIIDRFLACDLSSKGGFSYWFRSPTEDEGLPTLEIPYAKKLSEGSFDSYCGVVPPTRTSGANVSCLSVGGLGFGSGSVPDPNPPDRVRVRLRTYENLLFWVPLIGNSDEPGMIKDRIGNIKMHMDPVNNTKEGIKTSGGSPYLRALKHPPINQTNVLSLMVKPNENATSGSDELILFAGDDAYMNEISIRKTITNKVQFSIYEGKAETFTMTSGSLKPGVWNHILVQYKNGYWYLYIDGLQSGKKTGPRHSFLKRGLFTISRPLPEHTQRGFTGSIADIRLYSRTLSKTGIDAIKDDFEYTLHENDIKH